MNNRHDDQLIENIDPTILNEQISNDQYFDRPDEFQAPHSQNIIEKLIHLARFSNLLTLVVGNNGSGKSYLLSKLVADLEDNYQICQVNAQPLISIDQLFQQVTESFAGETTFSGIPLTANQYEQWAEQLTTVPGNRMLIIDDAEVLSTSVLHELCQLSAMQQEKDTPHLHIILFGNYDLNNILEQASQGVLDENGIYAIDLPAMNDSQSKKWLEFLFAKSGVVFLPEPDEFEKILMKGQGNFSLLEELAVEFSAISHDINEFEKSSETWKISVIGYWFGALTLVIMLILGLFFFQKEITQLLGIDNNGTTAVAEIDSETLDTKKQSYQQNSTVQDTMKDIQSTDAVTDSANNKEDTAGLDDEDVQIENESISDTADGGTTSADSSDLLEAEIDQEILVNKEQGSELQDNNQLDNNTSSLDSESTATATATATNTDTANGNLTADEHQLISESDESFAVQIIGLREESSVKAFIAKYHIDGLIYYQSSLAGKPWFIVVLNNFNSKDAAISARANLPEEIRKNGPWIKPLKTIKKEIAVMQVKID